MSRALTYWLIGLTIAAIVALRLYLLYWGFIYDGFLVPPGDDVVNHLHLIEKISNSGLLSAWAEYPPLFHLLIMLFSNWLNISNLQAMMYVGPALIGLVVIAVFVTSKLWFGAKAGTISAALVGLAGAGPLYGYVDGNYPNLLASGFFMILGFGYFIKAFESSPYRNTAVAAVCFILLALTHHLSFLLFATIMACYFIIFIIGSKIFKLPSQNSRIITAIIFPTAAVALMFGLVFFGKSLLIPALVQIIKSGAPGRFDQYVITPITLGQYPEVVGSLVWYTGVISLLVLFGITTKVSWEKRWFLITWIVVIFVLSRLSLAGLPGRFARELTIPLAIAVSFSGAFLIDLARSNIRRLLLTGALAGLIVLNTVMLLTGPFALPEGFSRQVWFWPEDVEKLKVLQALPANSRIASTPSSPYYEVFLDNKKLTVTQVPNGYDYIFISPKARGVSDTAAYPYFSNYDNVRKSLETFTQAITIVAFPDGAVLKKISR